MVFEERICADLLVRQDLALRACAKCVCATAVVAGTGIMIGEIVGGGPIGMALGAACTTPLAIHLQSWLAEYIQDPRIQNEVLVDFTPEAVLGEAITNGIILGVRAHFNNLLLDLMGLSLKTMGARQVLVEELRSVLRQVPSRENLQTLVGQLSKSVESVLVIGFVVAFLKFCQGDKVSMLLVWIIEIYSHISMATGPSAVC